MARQQSTSALGTYTTNVTKANNSTPPQRLPVDLSLDSGSLELTSLFKSDQSSSYVAGTPARDTVVIGDQSLSGWEFSECPHARSC